MKRKRTLIGLISIGIICICSWYFFPTLTKASVSLPKEKGTVLEKFGLNQNSRSISGGGTLSNSFYVYPLGAGRTLILECVANHENAEALVTTIRIKYWGLE